MAPIRGDSAGGELRWAVWLMIVASMATVSARLATIRATTGETPMLSANDRSRWCTVRALVEDGTYAIDRLVEIRHPETKRRYWRTIDMVRHRGPDGREHYYSSKPPLFSTLVAIPYWALHAATGASLEDHPFVLMRVILLLVNVLPLLLYFLVLWWCLAQTATSDRAVLYAMAAAAWGTPLTTFAVTLNNHLPAAIAVLIAMACALRIAQGARQWGYFAGAGLAAAFGVANELPSLAFLACLLLWLVWQAPRQTLAAFLPAVAVVAAAFFATNYLSHGTWIPPYAWRSDGPVITRVATDAAAELDAEHIPAEIREALAASGVVLSDQAVVAPRRAGERWSIWDRVGAQRFAAVKTADGIELRYWHNWYDYDGSYWNTDRQGVDRGEASVGIYAWHALLGHHGLISLTPVWLLSIWGAATMLAGRPAGWRTFAAIVVSVTAVCLLFYLGRPPLDRNYGGVSCGFRWMFWFIPLWLICLVPAADRLLARRAGRVLALLLLAVSVFSAMYSATNPWSHPWIFQWGAAAGWW